MSKLYFAGLHECNENCLFCVKRGDETPVKYIPTKEAKEIFQKKRAEGYNELCFDGGEPTLRPDLAELIDYAKKIGYERISVLSNGTLLSDEKLVKKLLPKRKDGFRPSFSISLHSRKKGISEKLVGVKNTFEKTLKGIQNLIDAGNGDHISVYHVITKYNYADMPEFVDFIHKKFPAIKYITFSFIYPAGAALKNKHILPQLSKAGPKFKKALERSEKYGIKCSIAVCGTIPLCFLKGHEDILLDQQKFDSENVGLYDSLKEGRYQLASKEFHEKTKVKATKCRKCARNAQCSGIWKPYVDLYGLGELKPYPRNSNAVNVLLYLIGFTCNNNCVFCSNVADRDVNKSTEEILEMIKKSAPNYDVLELIGGEAAIRKDFFELLIEAKKAGFPAIQVTSNGRIFSYPEFVKKAKKAGLDKIIFSLHGHTKQLHEAVTRSPGSYEQCVAGIKNALAEGLIVNVNTVISRFNKDQINEIGEFVRGLGVKEWHLLELLPDGRAEKNYAITAVDYVELDRIMARLRPVLDKFEKTYIFDFPFCIFGPEYFGTPKIDFMVPGNRYEHVFQGDDNSCRIEKTGSGTDVQYHDKYKTKADFCADCAKFKECAGVAKPYFAKRGGKDILKLARAKKIVR